jgi:energy-coupling factor transporter ATP-binding protein EcfA2
MIKIEVKGFQAIENVELSIDRFTAIVGGSNIGKSSVVRAIKCALTNSVGTSFVRHEEYCARKLRGHKTCKCQASVHIVMEGFDLLWEKGDAINKYTFNKQVYDKPGTGIPEFLITSGFSPVKIGDTSGSIQIADQFFPIFMLNQSGPAIAEAISDVSRLDRINRASKASEKDRKEASSSRKIREEDSLAIRVRLQKYEGLDEALQKVVSLEQNSNEVDAVEASVSVLDGFIETLRLAAVQIRALTTVGSASVPEIASVSDPYKSVKVLDKFATNFKRREEDCDSLNWVDNFSSAVPEIEPISDRLKLIKSLDQLIERARNLKEKFKLLDAASKSRPPLIDGLTQLHAKVVNISNFIQRLAALKSIIDALTTELDTHSAQEKDLESEATALGVCPYCVQPLSLGHHHPSERKYA